MLLFFCFFWGTYITRKIINPLSLASLSISVNLLSVYLCDILDLLRLASINDIEKIYTVIFIGQSAFLLPWLFFSKKTHDGIISSLPLNNINILKISAVISVVGICIASLSLGGLPIYQMAKGVLNVNSYNDSLSNLPLGLLAIISVNQSIFFLIFSEKIVLDKKFIKSKSIILWILLSFIICIWQGKRQFFLFLIFITITYFILYSNFKIKKNIFYLILILPAFIFIFQTVSNLRNNRDNTESTKNFEILEYGMYAPMNMASILDYYPPGGTAIFPSTILSEILPKRFVPDQITDYKNILFEPTSPSSYFAYWYIDYGFLGVFVGMLLLSFVSKVYYHKQIKEPRFRKAYILLLWCCITIGVYNHFISLIFFIIPFLLLHIIDLKINFTVS